MKDFKSNFRMVGLSADWINECWSVEQEGIVFQDDEKMSREIVVFKDDDGEYLVLACERTNDYEDLKTAIIYQSDDEDNINNYLDAYDLFYSEHRKQWVRTSHKIGYTKDLILIWE